MGSSDEFREKKWRHVYTRSAKQHRAKQLGMPYPRENQNQSMDREILRVLFVCSMNQWRSPTAERIYAEEPLLETRSRGTSHRARRTVSSIDLRWADVLFAMEPKHLQRLQATFPGEMKFKEAHVLDIPDEYREMDPELITRLRAVVDPLLGLDPKR